jgi:hypothetical protein
MACRPRDGDPTTDATRRRSNAPNAPSTPTTVGEQLEWAANVLGSIGAPDPAGEAAAILASVMGLPGVPLEPDLAAPLAASDVDRFLVAIARRTRDEPPRS